MSSSKRQQCHHGTGNMVNAAMHDDAGEGSKLSPGAVAGTKHDASARSRVISTSQLRDFELS
jgi:hypothetical protein